MSWVPPRIRPVVTDLVIGYERALDIRMFELPPATKLPLSETQTMEIRKAPLNIAQSVPLTMNLSAFKDPMCFAFLFDHSSWSSYGSPWIQLAAEGKFGSLGQQACQSLAQCVFGRRYALIDIELDAATGYGKTMSGTRAGLSDQATDPARLLVPMLILMIQASVRISSSETGSHIRGVVALLQTCGPRAFQSSHLRTAYSSCRSTLITIGIMARRRTFLEDSEWRTDPWAGNNLLKSSQDELVFVIPCERSVAKTIAAAVRMLGIASEKQRKFTLRSSAFLPSAHVNGVLTVIPSLPPLDHTLTSNGFRDVLSAVPGFLEDLGNLQQNRLAGSDEYEDLCLRIQLSLTELYQWRIRWDFAHPNVAWEVDRLPSVRTLDVPQDARRMLCYTSFARAVEHSLYNGILMSLLGLLHLAVSRSEAQIHSQVAAQIALYGLKTTDTGPLLSVGQNLDLHGCAMEAVRAFEYQVLHIQHRRDSALYWLFPLGLAYQVLVDVPGWTTWIGRMRDASHESRGYGRSADTSEWFGYLPLPIVARVVN